MERSLWFGYGDEGVDPRLKLDNAVLCLFHPVSPSKANGFVSDGHGEGTQFLWRFRQ